jgi:hypothetical protein
MIVDDEVEQYQTRRREAAAHLKEMKAGTFKYDSLNEPTCMRLIEVIVLQASQISELQKRLTLLEKEGSVK